MLFRSIVELVGGLEPAHEWVRRALERGVSVVTANKQLIARHGAALLDCAQAHGSALRFEASVAGGVPVLRVTLDEAVARISARENASSADFLPTHLSGIT